MMTTPTVMTAASAIILGTFGIVYSLATHVMVLIWLAICASPTSPRFLEQPLERIRFLLSVAWIVAGLATLLVVAREKRAGREAPPLPSKRWARASVSLAWVWIMLVTATVVQFGLERRSSAFAAKSDRTNRAWLQYSPTKADPYRHLSESDRAKLQYYEDLTRKYVTASKYPWLPVEPDPPVPE